MIYGLPLDKMFPLNTKEEIMAAIYDFNNCQMVKRKMLADNINKELLKHEMIVKVPESSDFKNYIDDSNLAGIVADNRYTRLCNSVCSIEFHGNINGYNRQVFDHLVERANDFNDPNEYSSFISTANEYADNVMVNGTVLPKVFTLCMELVDNIINSLLTAILDFAPSEQFVKKLLDDLEEFFILYSTSVWYMKRKILSINHMASRIGTKNSINKMIAVRTQQLLNNETSLFNQLKLSKGYMAHTKDCDNIQFMSYLKDKQMELKSYFDLQYGYFLHGSKDPGYKKSTTNEHYTAEYIMLSCMQDEIMIKNIKGYFTKKYPKLTLDIDYATFFKLRSRYKHCKQFSIHESVVTVVVLNKIPYLVCKHKHEPNVLYLINYNIIQPCPEHCSEPIKAIKIKFKNKVLQGSVDKLLESSMKF